MALYDGFFDATFDDETQEYDRAYGSGDFTGYFENIVGSGVCVHDNPGSFKAEYEDGTLYLRPGYLFIRGYWLANKAGENEAGYKGYAVTLPTGMTGSMAVVAHLNLGQRLIEIQVQPVSQAYPDSLVLAIITTTTAEDTRHNTDVCGVIDTAGELSTQVEWAVNYINTEIESKLQQVEQDIAAQDAKLDAKIAEVQAVADSIVPPPVGSIKFSAAQNVGEDWLQCDGRFVNEADYPELVTALGKLTPSADKFQLVSSGEIGPQISNGVVYGGRMWVYSYSTKKLYGVDLTGTAEIKEITITSEDTDFSMCVSPTTAQPIALSIVKSPVDNKARLFLAQIMANYTTLGSSTVVSSVIWMYCAEFSETSSTLDVSKPFTTIANATGTYFSSPNCVPYVISRNENGKEWFYCTTGMSGSGLRNGVKWDLSGSASSVIIGSGTSTSGGQRVQYSDAERIAYDKKNKDETVFVLSKTAVQYGSSFYAASTIIDSDNNGTFTRGDTAEPPPDGITTTPNALPIAGQDILLFEISKTSVMTISINELEAAKAVSIGLSLPSAARIFVDGGAYLWGKDIYMIFVGTGIIFSRTLEEGDFGYLDTTSVLGTITQFGYLDYSQDEGTLYLLGQDTTNTVKVAKIVLNTLYDYANDGAWLPMIAADGVPAYIKAKEDGGGEVITDPVNMNITVTISGSFGNYADVIFNGGVLISGTFTRTVSASGTFTVGIRQKATGGYARTLKLNGTQVVSLSNYAAVGTEETATYNVSDFISGGITLDGYSS